MPGKGLTTAELKKLYMKNLKGKQSAEQKGISSKNFVRMYMAYNGDIDTEQINKAVNRLEGIREDSVYKPQTEKASTRFDKNTKYDDLLGRSTNPDKKFKDGGMMKAKKKTYKKGGSFEDKANKGNNAAKYLKTGKGPDGFPLTARTRKMYEQIAKKNKNVQMMSPAPFEDDGMRKRGGMMPKYKK